MKIFCESQQEYRHAIDMAYRAEDDFRIDVEVIPPAEAVVVVYWGAEDVQMNIGDVDVHISDEEALSIITKNASVMEENVIQHGNDFLADLLYPMFSKED